jgi:hypothetical protein
MRLDILSVWNHAAFIENRTAGQKNEHCARVKYDEHQELDVSERLYRARGYQPPFDELPWLDEIATT